MTTAAPRPPAAREPKCPGLVRLTTVELRKMVDTRAGLWLQLAVLALTVAAVVVLASIGDADDRGLRGLLEIAVQPAAILLPVVGVLLVTSEWTQRTALITFTLVPRRSRVLAAKLGAGVALSLTALSACLAIAAMGTAITGSDIEGAWSLSPVIRAQLAVYLASATLVGMALGAALLASAPAIVAYFVLPLAWSLAGSLSLLEGPARWLDPGRTLSMAGERVMDAGEWARAGTSLALWILVPLSIGAWRILRRDLRVS